MVDFRQTLGVQAYVQERLVDISEAKSALKGTYLTPSVRQLKSKSPSLFYSHPHGEIWL
jgi:hypothetical protein